MDVFDSSSIGVDACLSIDAMKVSEMNALPFLAFDEVDEALLKSFDTQYLSKSPSLDDVHHAQKLKKNCHVEQWALKAFEEW